jgi:hypothetical protein
MGGGFALFIEGGSFKKKTLTTKDKTPWFYIYIIL